MTDPFDSLLKRAEEIAATIAGDFPELETGYDLYVEELDGVTFGVIDMGDAYKEAFVWEDGEWDLAPTPPDQMATTYAFVIEDRILEKRRIGSGW